MEEVGGGEVKDLVKIGSISIGKHGFDVGFLSNDFGKIAKGNHDIYISMGSLNNPSGNQTENKKTLRCLKKTGYCTHNIGGICQIPNQECPFFNCREEAPEC